MCKWWLMDKRKRKLARLGSQKGPEIDELRQLTNIRQSVQSYATYKKTNNGLPRPTLPLAPRPISSTWLQIPLHEEDF